jgi:hypothetical protein
VYARVERARLLQAEGRGDQVRIAFDREREEHEDEHAYREHDGFEEGDAQETAGLLRHGATFLEKIPAGIVKASAMPEPYMAPASNESSNDSPTK